MLSRVAILHFLSLHHILHHFENLIKAIHTLFKNAYVETTQFIHTFGSFREENTDFYHPEVLLKNGAEIINVLFDKLSLSSRDYGQMESCR